MNLRSGLLGVTSLLACTVIASAQSVDLTAALRSEGLGSYTYYALGNSAFESISPFTSTFFPGGSNSNRQEPGHPGNTTQGGAISFASGKLTNGLSHHFVNDWHGVVGPVAGGGSATEQHAGVFQILFDLDAIYNISDVLITYSNSSGERWDSNFTQKVYTSTTFNGSMDDFVLLGAQNFLTDGSNILRTAEYDADVSGVHARYVLLELTASLSAVGTTSALGGKLIGVTIMGDPTPVPEPAAVAALMASACGVLLWHRHRKGKKAITR